MQQDYREVLAGFNENLFRKLNPPFPPVRLLRFDGSQTGDRVILQLNFLLFKQTWESLITENQETSQEIYFVDEGQRLPFFLNTWRHKHRLLNHGDQTEIIEDIEYTCPPWLNDRLMYPILYLQFLYRKPIYQKIFSRNKEKQ